uniref:Uncharacterized protein n=1 Tax=Anguilla anguilla TaxID=7936 RepID=A0A0E9PBX0_ANGAN
MVFFKPSAFAFFYSVHCGFLRFHKLSCNY